MSQKEQEGFIVPFVINLTKSESEILYYNSSVRGMKEEEYVCHLIRNDNPKMYGESAADVLRQISFAEDQLEHGYDRNLIDEIQKGVAELWLCL